MKFEWSSTSTRRGIPSSDRPPEAVAGAVLDVADPGRHHAARAAGGEELVEADVGDRADEGQVTPALADQLVGGGEGDQALERRPQHHGRAVGDVPAHRLGERDDLAQRAGST